MYVVLFLNFPFCYVVFSTKYHTVTITIIL